MGGGSEVREGGHICVPVADHVDVWQKPAKYFKAISLQLKIFFLKEDTDPINFERIRLGQYQFTFDL